MFRHARVIQLHTHRMHYILFIYVCYAAHPPRKYDFNLKLHANRNLIAMSVQYVW